MMNKIKIYLENFEKTYLEEGLSPELDKLKSIQENLIQKYYSFLIFEFFFNLEPNLKENTLTFLYKMRVRFQEKGQFKVSNYISEDKFNIYQRFEKLKKRQIISQSNQNKKNIKKDENLVLEIFKIQSLFYEGNISYDLANKIILIENDEAMKDFINKFTKQSIKSEKFAFTLAFTLSLISESCPHISKIIKCEIKKVIVDIKKNYKQDQIINKIWFIIHLCKFNKCNLNEIINIFIFLMNEFNKISMYLLNSIFEREFYFFVKEQGCSERFTYFINQLKNKHCPNIECNEIYNKLMKTLNNILKIFDVKDMNEFDNSNF